MRFNCLSHGINAIPTSLSFSEKTIPAVFQKEEKHVGDNAVPASPIPPDRVSGFIFKKGIVVVIVFICKALLTSWFVCALTKKGTAINNPFIIFFIIYFLDLANINV